MKSSRPAGLALLLAGLGLLLSGGAAAALPVPPRAPDPPLASSGSPPESTPRLASLPVDKITRGQTGYGLTVFAGSEPERFDVEVLGVLHNTDPSASYVLARLSGHGLDESGVVQGMSGSPVFIDEHLVGAVAFAWPFAKEAIAGITPIDAMRSIGELPSGLDAPDRPDGRDPVPVGSATDLSTPATPPLDLASLLAGKVPEGYLETVLSALAPRLGQAAPGARSAIEWATSGFGETARKLLAGSLGEVAASGGATSDALPALQNGAPVAAVLVDGDLQLAATGTVTERHGSEILAFGHAFLGYGPLDVPMASAEILTVLPSNYNSFKISNLGPVVGAFETDSQAGIRGRLGATAPMIPFHLSVRGLRARDYHMRLAAVPQLVPALLAAATVGGINSASFSNGPQGLDLDATFHLARWGDVPVRQSFDGPTAASDASAYLVALAGYLTGNSLEKVEITGIDAVIHQTAKPRNASLAAAHAERAVVHPGERVRLNLDFKSFQGASFRRTVEVKVPEDLPSGRLSLVVGDGQSIDAARMALEPVQPVTFPQALGLLRSMHSNRDLLVLEVFRDSGLSVAGNTLPRLPGSIQSIWRAAGSGGAKPLGLALTQVKVDSLPFPASGVARIDLELRRREPDLAQSERGHGDAEEAGPPPDEPEPDAPPPPEEKAGGQGAPATGTVGGER